MLLGEADGSETESYTLDGPLSRPFQDGLFVDMQADGDGASVEQGRFYWIHGPLDRAAPRVRMH